MGMLACYQKVDVAQIEALKTKSNEEIMEQIEKLENDSTAEVYSMDKLWDGLHCLLTGVSASRPIENNLLSEAVVGTDAFIGDEDADFVAYVLPVRAKEILKALEDFDIKLALSTFSPNDFNEKQIYPNIWIEQDKKSLQEELYAEYEGLRKFYAKIVCDNSGIIVSIF